MRSCAGAAAHSSRCPFGAGAGVAAFPAMLRACGPTGTHAAAALRQITHKEKKEASKALGRGGRRRHLAPPVRARAAAAARRLLLQRRRQDRRAVATGGSHRPQQGLRRLLTTLLKGQERPRKGFDCSSSSSNSTTRVTCDSWLVAGWLLCILALALAPCTPHPALVWTTPDVFDAAVVWVEGRGGTHGLGTYQPGWAPAPAW